MNPLNSLDDFSLELTPKRGGYLSYKGSVNQSLISYQAFKEYICRWKKAYCLVSAFQNNCSKAVNLMRHVSLRKFLQDNKFTISTFAVVGETEVKRKVLIDRGFIVNLPNQFSEVKYKKLLEESYRDFLPLGCSCFVESERKNVLITNAETTIKICIGGDGLEASAVSRLYSKYCLSRISNDYGIVIEIPNGSIMSFVMYNSLGINYFLPEGFFDKKKK